MIARWPEFTDRRCYPTEEQMLESLKSLTRGVRNLRAEMNVPNAKKARVFVVSGDEKSREWFDVLKEDYQGFIGASEVCVQSDKSGIADDAVSVVLPNAVVYIPFAELVDVEKERERLTKERERLTKELARVDGMLSNERFLAKAPEAKIAEERQKKEKYAQMMAKVEDRLSQLG